MQLCKAVTPCDATQSGKGCWNRQEWVFKGFWVASLLFKAGFLQVIEAPAAAPRS